MKALKLSREVIVTGWDLFGKWSYIRFIPYNQPGWYWNCGGVIIPITKELVKLKKNQIIFQRGRKKLHIVEHIMALRWSGLDGVIIQASPWPPYHGGPQEMWQALKPRILATNQNITWIKPSYSKFAMGDRYVEIIPNDDKCLTAVIKIDYPKFGRLDRRFAIEKALSPSLESCFQAKALAGNTNSQLVETISEWSGRHVKRWKHHENLTWPRQFDQAELLELITDHRLVDLLGALAMMSHEGLPAADVISYKGGHKLDLGLLQQL